MHPSDEMADEENIEEIDLFASVKEFGLLFVCFFFGYLIGYWSLSTWWLLIVALCFVIRKKHRLQQQRRVEFQRAVANDEKSVIKCSVKDLPCWVYFPVMIIDCVSYLFTKYETYLKDTERAEWVNKILKQLWPFIGEYMKNMLKTQVEKNIDDIMPDYCKGFRFEKIDLGTVVFRFIHYR